MSDVVKPKRKAVNGKKKGNSFEGAIAKLFTKTFAPLSFCRSPGSGARVGGKNFETFGKMFGEDALKIFVADVVCLNERDTGITFLHSIECKFYKTPDSLTSIINGSANIYKWFEESRTDAAKTNKNPILIFKWNNTPVYVAGLESVIPDNINTIRLNNDIRVCLLDDLLPITNFWIKHNTI